MRCPQHTAIPRWPQVGWEVRVRESRGGTDARDERSYDPNSATLVARG
jgi:hypothetical protein